MLPTDHPLWSYRLAKFEVAAEKRGVGRETFANFERNLAHELRALRPTIQSATDIFRDVGVGRFWLRPKSIEGIADPGSGSLVQVPEPAHDHHLQRLHVRVMLEPSPSFATCEVAWIRAFGPVLDRLLSLRCRGNRLDLRGTPPEIPAGGRQVFRYWAPEYKKFRSGAIQAARECLETAGRCVLTALDLTSYYDNIDPNFLLDQQFVTWLDLVARTAGIKFQPEAYRRATSGLLGAYGRFRAAVADVVGIPTHRGIPIGSLSARLIANLALVRLDRHIELQRSVRHYARYVDDILVVEVPGAAESTVPRDVVARLLPLDDALTNGTRYVIDSELIERPGSKFIVQTDKLRVFDLRGKPGSEYLAAVEAEIQQASSERRRFLEPSGEVERTLSASNDGEPIHALRQADVLSIRRFAAGTIAGKVTTAAAMLDRGDARAFSRKHLAGPSRVATEWSQWVDLIDVSLHMLGAALQAGDGDTANEIIETVFERCSSLTDGRAGSFSASWNGSDLDSATAARLLREWVEERIVEVVCAAVPFDDDGFTVTGVSVLEAGIDRSRRRIRPASLLKRAILFSACDLRLADRESERAIGVPHIRRGGRALRNLRRELANDVKYAERVAPLREFRAVCRNANDDAWGMLGPVEMLLLSKPPSVVDVLLRWLSANRPLSRLMRVVNAIRGTGYPPLPIVQDRNVLRVLPADDQPALSATRLVLGNLFTDEAWWEASLVSPARGIERQEALAHVINEAVRAASRAPRVPTMLVLPELSLPRQWAREVCGYLLQTRPLVSLVAGLEYDVVGSTVYNEVLGLVPRAGWVATGWLWPKRHAAEHEGAELTAKGFSFAARDLARRLVVMSTEHGAFVPLVCSELLEVRARASLPGAVDLVLVPAWNQDTGSFEHLINATALELHSFVAVANNALYSDCRIRAPFSEGWRREVARLIMRRDAAVVAADLPVALMREFQQDPAGYEPSKTKPAWKPLPPGFMYTKE